MRAIKCGEARADSVRRNVEQAEEMQQTLLAEIQNLAVNAELGLKILRSWKIRKHQLVLQPPVMMGLNLVTVCRICKTP